MIAARDRISQAELRRRHDLVRTKMKERGLDVLLVSGVRFVAAAGYLRYLTNWAEPFGGEILVFPAKGEPRFLARTAERSLLVKQYLGLQASAGSTAAHAAAMVKAMGWARVGLCSVKTMFAEFYLQLTAALPGATLVEAGDILDEARMIKSEEELGWVRQSAHLTDVAFEAFSKLVRPGRCEADVFIEIDHLLRQLGAENTYFMMAADPHPVAKFLDLAADTYEPGDVVLFNAEVAGPGGYFTQLERTLCVGPATPEVEAAYGVCLKAENTALALLRPGVKASEVFRAIVSAIEGAGHRMGLHPGHSQGLDIFERPLIDDKEEAELAAGMIIVIHPHVLMPSGGGVWIGNTFLITSEGPRPLQESARALTII
ncbi:MAG TPA: Xaa-Pro peptidase family protein [Xanthobacteraceae bacterium]